MNPIVKADIKVDSKEFSDANDDQANYDGNRCIIICSSILLMLYKFNLTFIIYFMTIFSFLSNMDYFIQLYFWVSLLLQIKWHPSMMKLM